MRCGLSRRSKERTTRRLVCRLCVVHTSYLLTHSQSYYQAPAQWTDPWWPIHDHSCCFPRRCDRDHTDAEIDAQSRLSISWHAAAAVNQMMQIQLAYLPLQQFLYSCLNLIVVFWRMRARVGAQLVILVRFTYFSVICLLGATLKADVRRYRDCG